jgi:hypothetical protein
MCLIAKLYRCHHYWPNKLCALLWILLLLSNSNSSCVLLYCVVPAIGAMDVLVLMSLCFWSRHSVEFVTKG